MTRTTAPLRRTAAAAAVPALLTLWAAGPAQAHGAPTDPVSRVFACSPDGGGLAGSAACRAAVAANGAPFTAWDNLRVANVGGRDRQVVPDGKLCSGGLPAYKGLDLARDDWPSTRLVPGAGLTMSYASTIPHEGTFKLYLTRQGYDPAKPLTWSDLPAEPFAEVKDPPLTGGAYRIGATLPADRTGRHVLFTIWQNSSTPDTYYSCSDVVFAKATKATKGTKGAGGTNGTGGTSGSAGSAEPGDSARSGGSPAAGTPKPGTQVPSPSPSHGPHTTASARQTPDSAAAQARSGAPDSSPVASATDSGQGPSAPLLAGGAAAVLVLTGGAALALRLRGR
ncbi:lytic polysaccharide monooxygenase [Streptomyces sp. NPDC057596]|uniref:lytic polysaccharide monooxygenase auxiliary activity family 9 protein n=1 Tax=Streptomyces sp. NPDC057596 TaxID=3346178 RepID=UPI0036954CD8